MPAAPSLLIVPYRSKTGRLYSQIPVPVAPATTGAGDFNVTRNTTATRFNSAGLIESVASGIPRLDYYTSGGTAGCPALLVEPAATNLARWVNQMTAQDTPAASGGMTITTGSTDFLAPDGTSGSITKYVGGAASGTSQYAYYAGGSIVATASGAHTYSLFVKRGATNPLNFCALGIENYGGTGTTYSYFNLASGTALTAGASVQNYGNGWYRLTTPPYTLAGDLTGTLSFFMAEGNGDLIWPASGALNLTAYTWGAQFEAGSAATSYIPTTTATGSRAADVISVSGAVSGSIGQTEGVLYIECESNDGLDDVFFINRSTANSIYLVKLANNSYIGRIRHSTTNTISFTSASGITGMVKIAIAYKSGDSTMYLNGSRVGVLSTTAITFNGALDTVGVNKTAFFEGAKPSRIRAVALYTTRLTDAELATLTTP